jgi:hypothetical protein
MSYTSPTSARSGLVRTAETVAVNEIVIRLPDDYAVKVAVKRALSPPERRRFRALWDDARRDPGCGVRPAIKIALRRMVVG